MNKDASDGWPVMLDGRFTLGLGRHDLGTGEALNELILGDHWPPTDEHMHAITKFVDAGYDEVYVNQIGPNQEGFFTFYGEEILPRLGKE